MPMLHAVLIAAVLLILAKTAAWLIQRQQGNGGIVDAIWAWALGGLAVWFAFTGSAAPQVRWTLAAPGGPWGLRPGAHPWRRDRRPAAGWGHAPPPAAR